MIYVTADHHFGHFNIIKYCGRPFASAPWMGVHMIREWNEVVAPEDEVWHLGDLILGTVDHLNALTKYLNGETSMIKGNHDRLTWRQYEAAGIKRLFPAAGGPQPAIKRIGQQSYILSHRPPANYTVAEQMLRLLGSGSWWLHGHSHGKRSWTHPKVIDVGVDCWNFRPIPLNQFT